MKKKLLALLLTVAMLLSMMPMQVFAAEEAAATSDPAQADGVYAAGIGETGYATLAEAIEAAQENDIVTLCDNADEEVVVSKPLTIAKNGFTAIITAGEGYAVEETEAAYVVVEVKTSGVPYLIEGVEDRTVIIQTGFSYQLHDVSNGRIFTDGDNSLTYESYRMRKSSDGGQTWSEWEIAFKALEFGGITDSVVNSTAGIYVYEFKAVNEYGESEDIWRLTLDTRDEIPSDITFYVGQDQNYKTNGSVMPVLELYRTAGIDEESFDYVGWFETSEGKQYVYDPHDYEIADGETDYIEFEGRTYELHDYEKITFTNSAFDDADETAAASGTMVGKYNAFYATVFTGRYSTRAYGRTAEGKEVYLGGQSMELPRETDIYGGGGNDVYLRLVSLYTTSKKLDSTYFTADDYYAEILMPITGSMIHAGDPYISGNYTYFPFMSWAAGNGSLYNCYVYPCDTDSYIFSQAINNTTSAGDSVVTKSMTISQAVELKATVPETGDFGLYFQYNNFNTKAVEPVGAPVNNGNGTKTVTYKMSKGNGNYTWRLTDPDGVYVTSSGWLKATADTEKTFAFSKFTDQKSHDFSNLGTQVDTRDEADVQTFLSATGFKSVSETTRIRAYRMWQIIDTDSANIMIEPDFNVNILQGDPDDIDLLSGGNVRNNWIDVTPTTTDIVAVNYDAMEVTNTSDAYGSHGGFYPATNPERTSVFVITNEAAGTAVAHVPFNGSKETDRGAEWDYNYDTWSYLNTDEDPELFFTAEGTGDLTVSYATVITNDALVSTLSDWTGLTAEDGTYYIDLLPFRTAGTKGGTVIIKMTDATGTSYSLVRVAEMTANVTNVSHPGEPIMPGDEVQVTFDGLYRSVNKISGVFNPTKYYLRYTSNGVEYEGALAQYQQMDRSVITLTIPEDLTFPEGVEELDDTFTNGYVWGTMYSASSPFQTMYYMTDTGMGTNFSAVGTEYVLSRLADISVTVYKKVIYDTKFAVVDEEGKTVTDYKLSLTDPDGNVLTPDASGIYQDLGYGEYTYALSKAGYVCQHATLKLGSADKANVADGILTKTLVIEKAAEGAWDGTTVTEPRQIDGIYQIGTGAELAWFAQAVNGGQLSISGALTADIDLACYNWTPIGNSAKKYSGIFDGSGYRVYNLFIHNDAYASATGAGLFGYGNACTIQNLTVDGSISLTSTASVSYAYAGGVLGGGTGVTLTNVHSGVDITITRVKGNWARAGGVFGGSSCNAITNCSYNGTLNGYQYCGGIAGYITEGTISNCCNAGTIYTVSTYAAGIVGSNAGGSTENCYNVGTVTAKSNYAGGIAASHSSGKLTNCYNTGVVSAANYVGAIAGTITKDTATVSNNYYLNTSCAAGIGKGTHTATAMSLDEMMTQAFVDTLNTGLDAAAYKKGETTPILVWQSDAAEEVLIGDINGDGAVDNTDAALVLDALAGGETLDENADLNGDGTVDSSDAVLILRR